MKKDNCKIIKILSSKWFMFLLSFGAIMAFSYKLDIINLSTDAIETWNVARTLFSSDKYYSYVMYKGIYAFLPCRLDQIVASALNLPETLLYKIFNSVCFAYVSVVGIPYLVGRIHKNGNVKVWQRYLLLSLMLLLERNITFFVSVDMISCTLFVLLCNALIKAAYDIKHWSYYIYIGVLVGFNICFSGQFSISTVIVTIAFAIAVIYNNVTDKQLIKRDKFLKPLSLLAFVLVGILVIYMPNKIYIDLTVASALEAGHEIKSGADWIRTGLSANLLIINYPRSLPDYLSLSILSPERYEQVTAGVCIITAREYIGMMLTHPISFIIRWSERLFLGVFNDPGNVFPSIGVIAPLNIIGMAIIVYGFYDRFCERFKKYRDFISLESAIYLGFLFTALVPSWGHVENRYYFTMRCIVYGVFCISPLLNDVIETLKNKIKNRTIEPVSRKFWSCIFFVLLSLMIYFAIYQRVIIS